MCPYQMKQMRANGGNSEIKSVELYFVSFFFLQFFIVDEEMVSVTINIMWLSSYL